MLTKNASVYTSPKSTCLATLLYLTVLCLELLCCLPLHRSDLVRHHHPVHLQTIHCSPPLHKATMLAHSKTRHMLSVNIQPSHAMHLPSTCVSGTNRRSYILSVAISSASAISVSPSHSTAKVNHWDPLRHFTSHTSPA
jgi:hypothetical protein